MDKSPQCNVEEKNKQKDYIYIKHTPFVYRYILHIIPVYYGLFGLLHE